MKWDHKQSVKEIIRHIGLVLGAERILGKYRQRHGYVTAHLYSETARERFRSVYEGKAWVHSKEQLSFSGLGSEAAATAQLIDVLPALLMRFSEATNPRAPDFSRFRRLPARF